MFLLQAVNIINEEEQQFLKTLARGRRLFNRTADKHQEDKVIPGLLCFVFVCCVSGCFVSLFCIFVLQVMLHGVYMTLMVFLLT
jgi:hypothetical protein